MTCTEVLLHADIQEALCSGDDVRWVFSPDKRLADQVNEGRIGEEIGRLGYDRLYEPIGWRVGTKLFVPDFLVCDATRQWYVSVEVTTSPPNRAQWNRKEFRREELWRLYGHKVVLIGPDYLDDPLADSLGTMIDSARRRLPVAA